MFDGKEYVYAVYEEKSFSKAAQKLYITQPALSTAIKKVEKKIGTPIFDRSTSPIGLTPGGEVYIDAIEKLFALEQNTLNQLNNLNGLLAGKLSVGGTIFFTSFVLPGVLSEFSHRYPEASAPGSHKSRCWQSRCNTDRGVPGLQQWLLHPRFFRCLPVRAS